MTRLVSLLFTLAIATQLAHADDGMRCDHGLVTVGMNQAEVFDRCGAPTRSEHREVSGRMRHGRVKITIDTWVYDRSAQEFTRTLTFHDGALQSVEVGEYGR